MLKKDSFLSAFNYNLGMAKRLLTSFVVLCVFSWLMPLGAFIKPGQEEMACGGKRAFHMCSCMGKMGSGSPVKPGINSASGFNENAKSSASGGDDLFISNSNILFARQSSKHYETLQTLKFQSPTSSIFHPPKASLLR